MSEKQVSLRNTHISNYSRNNNFNHNQIDRKDNNSKIFNKMSSLPNNRSTSSSGEIFLPPSRQHSKGGSKKKSGNANHLLNVQFERAINTSSSDILPNSSGTKKRSSRGSYDISKNQFLQANYKLVTTPYQEIMNVRSYDTDALVSWNFVEEVIVPVKDELIDCKCPICLDSTIIPKMSKCGHIMCFICTLQYLGAEYSKKCPICGEKINREDLKNVQYTTTNEPQNGKKYTFKLLTCEKGSLQPSVCREETVYSHGDPPPADASLLLCRSSEVSENSKFSRVIRASPDYLDAMLLVEQQTLLEVRTACLNSVNDVGDDSDNVLNRGNIEWLPSVTEALAIVEGEKTHTSLLACQFSFCFACFSYIRTHHVLLLHTFHRENAEISRRKVSF